MDEFVEVVSAPNPRDPSSKVAPGYAQLGLILQKLVDVGFLMKIETAGFMDVNSKYICPFGTDQLQSMKRLAEYVVYGFPAVFDDYQSSVLPIVSINQDEIAGVGTCFCRSRRLLVTAAHCVAGAKALSIKGVSVGDWSGVRIIVHREEAIDLAAIFFDRPIFEHLRRIELGTADILTDVLVMGYPMIPTFHDVLAAESGSIASRLTANRGTVASRALELFAKIPLLLVSAKVRGGFSGGPVLDSIGQAVGVVLRQPDTMKSAMAETPRYDEMGYGIAIPGETVAEFLGFCKVNDLTKVRDIDTTRITFKAFAS